MVSSLHNYMRIFLKDITTKIGSGATPRGGNNSYKNSGILLIRSLNVYDFKFEYDDLAFIDDEQAGIMGLERVSMTWQLEKM